MADLSSLLIDFKAEQSKVARQRSFEAICLWCGKFVGWMVQEKRILSDAKLVRDYATGLVGRGIKPTSAQTASVWIRKFIAYCRESGLAITEQLPLRLPRPNSPEKFTPSEAEVSEIIKKAKRIVPEPYATAIALLPTTGMRDGELIGLSMDDGDPDGKGGIILKIQNSKTGRGRTVPVLKTGVGLLTDYLRNVRPKIAKSSRWLFPNPGRYAISHISRKQMEYHIRNLRRELNLPRLTAHTLRSFYVTFLVGQGVSESTVAKLIGHSDLSTFQLYYRPSGRQLAEKISHVDIGAQHATR